MTKSSTFLFSISFFLLPMFLCGCVTHRDIAADSQYPSDYVIGAVYRTKQPLVAMQVESSLLNRHSNFTFMPPKNFPTPSDFQAQPKHFRRQYVLFPADTDVQVERFDLEINMENGTFMWIRSRILAGPLAGDELNLTFVSRVAGRSSLKADLLMVDTNFLEQIEHQ